MTRVATQDHFVTDEFGIRRLVVAGQPVPPSLQVADGELQTEEVGSLRGTALPAVDADAARSQAERTGDESSVRAPDEGISFDAAEGLQAAAREGETRQTRRRKAQTEGE